MKHVSTLLYAILLSVLLQPAVAQVKQTVVPVEVFDSRGEVYFSFTARDRNDIHTLTAVVDILNARGMTIYAKANRKTFAKFLEYGLGFTLTPQPQRLSEEELNPRGGIDRPAQVTAWDFYPTYDQYLGFMASFASAHPDICKIDTIGTTVEGRLLLAVRISDNVNVDEAEPQFLYTSSIHGDETTGYVLMLHLIDYLLTNYGTDPQVTDMVNNTMIVINPLANPDGTYHGGNNSVAGAIRENGNNINLNRNYPDPQDGPHPDGEQWQPETVAFMDYATQNHFAMGANFHGGAEVFNYPWDTWAKLHADDAWWQFVAREFADTIHAHSPTGYFTDENNGITNGYAWYEVNGGRQDYMNYYHHCREVTIEISMIKLLPASQLVNFWNYNYRSLLNYIRECRYGFNGIVTDTATGAPLEAKVYIPLHEQDFSEVYSRLPSGFYARPVAEGSWNVTFSATGYFSKTINNVQVSKWNTTPLNVQLKSLSYLAVDQVWTAHLVYPNPTDGTVRVILPENPVNPLFTVKVYGLAGNLVYSTELNPGVGSQSITLSLQHLPDGMYFLKLCSGPRTYMDKLIIRK